MNPDKIWESVSRIYDEVEIALWALLLSGTIGFFCRAPKKTQSQRALACSWRVSAKGRKAHRRRARFLGYGGGVQGGMAEAEQKIAPNKAGGTAWGLFRW